MATYEAGVFKDKHYDTLLDAQNDPTIEDRMTCFIAGKLYYKFGGVFQEVKMEIHNGLYDDLISIGNPEVTNPIPGVPYLFYDPERVTYFLMLSNGDGTFSPVKFAAYGLLSNSTIERQLIATDAIATHHIIDQNITTEKYAYNSIIGYNHILNGSIKNEQLDTHCVGTNNYSPYSITSGAIGNGEVKNANIDTGAVTDSKIANVDGGKITSGFEQSLSSWSSYVSDNTDFTIPALSGRKTRSYVYVDLEWIGVNVGITVSVQGLEMFFGAFSYNRSHSFQVPLVSDEGVIVSISPSSSDFTYRYRYVRETVFG